MKHFLGALAFFGTWIGATWAIASMAATPYDALGVYEFSFFFGICSIAVCGAALRTRRS